MIVERVAVAFDSLTYKVLFDNSDRRGCTQYKQYTI